MTQIQPYGSSPISRLRHRTLQGRLAGAALSRLHPRLFGRQALRVREHEGAGLGPARRHAHGRHPGQCLSAEIWPAPADARSVRGLNSMIHGTAGAREIEVSIGLRSAGMGV